MYNKLYYTYYLYEWEDIILMMIPEFKTIRNCIVNCCSNCSTDIEKSYEFEIDFVKLRNMFKQKSLDLHIMAFNKKIKSEKPIIQDLMLLTEYVKQNKDYECMFDGKTNIVQFMLFYSKNKDGDADILDDNDNELSEKNIFELCNGNKLDEDLIKTIVGSLPVFRIVVMKYFDFKQEQFKYKVFLRQNDAMIQYYSNHKENTSED